MSDLQNVHPDPFSAGQEFGGGDRQMKAPDVLEEEQSREAARAS